MSHIDWIEPCSPTAGLYIRLLSVGGRKRPACSPKFEDVPPDELASAAVVHW